MEKYYKKLSIMFVMVLAIMLGTCVSVFADDTYETGSKNLNNTTENSATMGVVLKAPEIGWKRADDTNSSISYSSNIDAATESGNYKSTYHGVRKTKLGETMKFNFTGNKLRLIGLKSNNYSHKIQIEIDGKIDYFDSNFDSSKESEAYQIVMYSVDNLAYGNHSVVITHITNISNPLTYDFRLDAIDIDKDGELLPYSESIVLDKSSMNLSEGDSGQLTATTTPAGLNVVWSSSDPNIASVDEATGEVKGVSAGTCIITATTADGLTATCTVNVSPQTTTGSAVILNIEPEKNEIKLNEAVTANLTIDNIKEIAAEDIRIKFDSTKLKFLGMSEANGIKLVKSEDNADELRVIVASEGSANVVNNKKILLKLNFQGIAPGDALVDVTKGRVSDGIEMEKDLTDDECGQAIIKIDNDILDDVNHSGEYTLLDLAIDARHLGEDPTGLPQYNTDQALNGAIDNDDLLKIGEYMLANPNYSPNN